MASSARRPRGRAGTTTQGVTPRDRTRRQVTLWVATFSCLAWIPGGFSRFVFAKLLVMAIACAIGALVPRHGRLPRSISVTLAVGAGLFVVAALVGETPVASLLGRWPRYEGLPVLGLYVASAWLGARVVGRGESRTRDLTNAVAGMTWALLAFSLLEVAGASPLGPASVDRPGSVLGNATDQGLVAMMAIAVLAAAVLSRGTPYLLASLAAAVVTLALSGSRTSILVAVGVVVALSLTRQRRMAAGALAVVGLLLVTVVALPQSRDRLLSTGTVRGRWLQWKLTGEMVGDHPLLGIGPNRYVDEVGRYENFTWIRFAGARTFPDSPHNWVLQVLVAGGIPLLLAALALAGLVVVRGWRACREHPEALGLFAAVVGYGVAMLANFTIASSTCLAAFLAGALLAEPVRTAEPVWRARVAVGVAGVAAAALFLGCISELRLQHGMDSAAAGRLAKAQDSFAGARALRPFDTDVSMLESQTLAELADQGDQKAAALGAQLAQESLDGTPDTYAAAVALGVTLRAQDQLDAARTVLDQAVLDFPERPTAYVQRGIVRFALGDVSGARDDLHRARTLAPDDSTPTRMLRIIAEQTSS